MLWTAFPCLAWHRIGMDPRSTQPLGTISVPLGPWHFSISLPITSCGLLLFGKFAKKKGEKNIVPLRHEIDRQARCEGHEESFHSHFGEPHPECLAVPVVDPVAPWLCYSWGKTTIRRIDACRHGTWGPIASYVAFAIGIETLYRQAFFPFFGLFCSFLVLLILLVRSSSWARG